MRGQFTPPCSSARPYASAQVRGAGADRVVGWREVARSAVSGKSLARPTVGSSTARNAGAIGPPAFGTGATGTAGALLSSDDFGSRVERGGGGQVLWRVHMRAADASAERRSSVVDFGVAQAMTDGKEHSSGGCKAKPCRRWRMLWSVAWCHHGNSHQATPGCAPASTPNRLPASCLRRTHSASLQGTGRASAR
jgi:hypothetical protein